MKGEIDLIGCENFYCVADYFSDGRCTADDDGECEHEDCAFYYRKHPTPEQYIKEYGEEWPCGGAVYYQHHDIDWAVSYLENVIDAYKAGNCLVVCACTPFGKPDKDWRPVGKKLCPICPELKDCPHADNRTKCWEYDKATEQKRPE